MKTQERTTALPRVALALALAVGLGLLAVPAHALGLLNTEQTGTLTLTVPEEARDDLAAGGESLPAETDPETDPEEGAASGPAGATVTVHLYKVADITANGRYEVVEGLKGTDVAGLIEPETIDEKWPTAEYWSDVTSQLLAVMYGDGSLVTPEDAKAGAMPTLAAGAKPVLTLDETKLELTAVNSYTGTATGLSLGLYLAAAEPAEGALNMYTFSPFLLTVPMADPTATEGGEGEAGGEGEPGTPGTADGWLYSYTAKLKPQQESRLGQLLIEKTLARYNKSLGETGFVFQVEARLKGKTVYKNVFMLKFSAAGTQQLLVPELPVGAEVTVTEVYSGATYKLTSGAKEQTVTVPALSDKTPNEAWKEYKGETDETTGTTAYVHFENDYDNTFKVGVSADNHYTNTDGTWSWTRTDAPAIGD